MKPKEAIERIERNICSHMDWCNVRDCTKCEVELSIDALEKQIPKKPTKSDREIRYCEVWECPSCGFEWSSRVVDYCYRCGQAIDWSEVE